VAIKYRIVIADDHPVFLGGLRQVIETDPTLEVVGESSDGESALAQIRGLKPDLAVVDISMPKLDGLELAAFLAADGTSVPIIFLTMYRERKLFDRALDLGVRGYVLKDSVASDILRAIHAVAIGEHFVSPALTSYLIETARNLESKSGTQDRDLGNLSPAERRVLELIADYKTSKEIAGALCISPRTVETHRTHICQKLGLHGNHALMKFALDHKPSSPQPAPHRT
jgi:DNA-binding NarL/FixJ family response regulator